MGSKIKYEVGDEIGNCTYIHDVPSETIGKNSKRRYAKFICPLCFSEFVSQIDSVKRGSTKSCGCLNIEMRVVSGKRRKKHGMVKTPLYHCWQRMKARCYNKNNPDYLGYGGRGISVCDEWKNSFSNFYEDIGKYYLQGYELERTDVNGDYSKENCRWATEQEQSWNQRIYKNNKTGCAGVNFTSRNMDKFEARISKDGVEHYLGTFDSFEEAVNARKQAEINLYGETFDNKRRNI